MPVVLIVISLSAILFATLRSAPGADSLAQRKSERRLPGWRTNVAKRTIDMSEPKAGDSKIGRSPSSTRPVLSSTRRHPAHEISREKPSKALSRVSSSPPIPHGDYFAFSWLVFKPDTEVYGPTPPGG